MPSRPGLQFVVSPMFDDKIVENTKRLDKISIPGAFTVDRDHARMECRRGRCESFPVDVAWADVF